MVRVRPGDDEAGFSLIELFVVMIIISVLAAIAIATYLNQRRNAWEGSSESDARNAAITLEAAFTELDDYPPSFEVPVGGRRLVCDDVTTATLAAGCGGAGQAGVVLAGQQSSLRFTNIGSGRYTLAVCHVLLDGDGDCLDDPDFAQGTAAAFWDNAAGGLQD